jgi:hypothetical protein
MFGTNNASDAALDYIFSDRHKDALSTEKQHFAEARVRHHDRQSGHRGGGGEHERLGFVYEPARVPDLQFSADYYNVDLTSAIAPEGSQAVCDRCFALDPTLAVCADEIALQPTTGDVSVIHNTYVNINAAKVAGWGFETSYSFEPDFLGRRSEAMSVRVLAGYLDELSESPLNRPKIDRAGSAITPDWTVTGIVSYNIGKLGLSLQQNWESDSKRNV